MRFGGKFLLVVLASSLAAYAIDCSAMTTPEAAMECCRSMPCSSHSHSQECCKTMPAMHAPFIQPHSIRGISLAHIVVAILPAFRSVERISSWSAGRAAYGHAPPAANSPPILALRI